MIYEMINYTKDGRVNLQTYIPKVIDGNPMPAIIFLPGGAWTRLVH